MILWKCSNAVRSSGLAFSPHQNYVQLILNSRDHYHKKGQIKRKQDNFTQTDLA